MARRLFVALEPPPETRAFLAGLDPRLPGVRWLPAGQLHLTLAFLGAVEPRGEERLRAALETVRVPPFFLPLRGVGLFGGDCPGVLWAGVGRGHPHLFALHKHVQDAILRAGLEPDLRAFHPHVTLARMKDVPRPVLKPFLRRHAETEFDVWPVSGFALFSSVTAAGGAIYTVEGRWKF